MCYLHLYLGLCFHHLTRRGLCWTPSCHLSSHPSSYTSFPSILWGSDSRIFIAWGNFACALFPGVFPSSTYPAWSQVGGDGIISQPIWATLSGVVLWKKKISQVQAQVRSSWWAKWILYEPVEAWVCGAGLLGSFLGDEREGATVFSSLCRDLQLNTQWAVVLKWKDIALY